MNKIQNYALLHADINLANLSEILEALEKRNDIINIDYILAVILGLESIPREFPQDAILRDGKRRARFRSYDILMDQIHYKYDDELRLWFKTAEDAKSYSDGAPSYNLYYNYYESDDCTFPGTQTRTFDDCCTRTEWLENAVK